MKLDFDVSALEYTVIRDILARVLPPDSNVWVFGSRAKGTARFNSDLDLAIDGKAAFSRSQIYALKEAFDDAPLSFRIDIVDLAEVDAGFRKIIEGHRVSFPMPNARQNHLRFPEFEGEWCEKALGPFIEEFREASTEQNQFEVLTSARSGLLKQKDYYDNDRITDRDNIGFNIIPPGYLTYRSRSDDRRFFFNENNLGITGIISVYYPVFRIVDGDNKFFIELLSRHINTIGKFSVGTSQTVLSMNELKKIKLPLPSPTEQKKIAAFLGVVDAKIAALRAQVSGLETYKRGLMQALFSQTLRFTKPNGTAFPDWEVKPFAEIALRVRAVFDPTVSNDKPTLVELENIESMTGRIIGESDMVGQISLKSVFRAGDVLFGKLRPYLRKFARPEFDGVCSSEIWVMRGTKVSNLYLYYLVQSSRFNQLANISSGSKMPRSDWSTIADSGFEIPHLYEQQKIADVLSAMDAKIQAVSAQVSHMEKFKKGLLQQMFV